MKTLSGYLLAVVERRGSEISRDFGVTQDRAGWLLGKALTDPEIGDSIYFKTRAFVECGSPSGKAEARGH